MAGAPYRTRNQLILAKIEGTSGVDASPTPGSDAVLFESPQTSPDLQSVETNEVTGSLDAAPSIPAGGTRPFSGSVLLKGSGAAGTPPEFTALLRASSMAETITASAIGGTASAGGASTITIEGADMAADGDRVGMPITIVSGTGAGQTRIIVANVESTSVCTVDHPWDLAPDATSVYSILANVQYRPGAVLPTASIYRYHHHADGANSKLEKLLGAAGNAVIRLSVRDACRIEMSFRSQLTPAADVSRPSDPTYDPTRPQPWIAAPTMLDGVKVAAASLSLDLGADVQMIDDPNEAYGYGSAGIVARRLKGELLFPKDTEATLDIFSSWATGATHRISTYWGTGAGNRVSLVIPKAVFGAFSETDRIGLSYWQVPFEPAADGARAALTFF